MKVSDFIAIALAIATPSAGAAQAASQSAPVQLEQGDTESVIQRVDDAHEPVISQAFDLVRAKRPAEAVQIADQVIARFKRQYAGEDKLIFSARSLTEAVYYGALAAAAKKSSVVLNSDWADAYFIKGFALIDLDRPDDAKDSLDRAVALAPMNSQLLAERAEWHKNRRDWAAAFAGFEAAYSAAKMAPDDRKNAEEARALRGMGFVRIEQGELKEAERLFKQCLKLEPDSPVARSELDFIKSLKNR